MKRICTICARGGSKGVKNKNLKTLAGKPLLAHTLQQAFASGLFDFMAVSSDSDDILGVAKQFGANLLIKRPPELATDTAGKLGAIRHAFEQAEAQLESTFDTLVDLDATSPLRSVDDIRGAVALLESKKYPNVVTGTPSRRSPYFNLVEIDAEGHVRLAKVLSKVIVRRQDAPPCFDLNASIYVWTRKAILSAETVLVPETGFFEMPEERSWDIDSELDFEFVDFMMRERGT